jgi:hypothetical protein
MGQVVLESLILALLSAVAATTAAWWVGGGLRAALLPDIVWGSSPVDLRVVVFTIALCVAAAERA